MWLFLAFLLVPLVEIALFIQVGGLIGLWPTLLVVVLTAVAGTWLVRSQGRQALERLRASFHTLRDPSEPLAHGAMILFSGALLLTPGFFTDAVGFLLLVPAVRRAAFGWLSRRVSVTRVVMGTPGGPGGRPGRDAVPPSMDTVEGEWTEVPPEKRPTHRTPSGWTRH
jgi:UPF0716 protein FxsA